MSSSKSIGGYFGLDVDCEHPIYSEAILLNSGRNCFEYVLKTQEATKVYIPIYTCEVMLEPINRQGIKFEFYRVDQNLEIKEDIQLDDNEFLVYTNYFGIKNKYCKKLTDQYGERLILDCSQAFYFEHDLVAHTFYSPRKFFGLPDGGSLYTNRKIDISLEQDVSYFRMSHLLKRIDIGAEAGYEDFKFNDASLSDEPIKQMSNLTKSLLNSIDHDSARDRRNRNFLQLHEILADNNQLTINKDDINGPMVYPYMVDDGLLRQKLIDNKIFVATYWPNVFDWSEEGDYERELVSKIIPLPIDQRYEEEDMKRILGIVI